MSIKQFLFQYSTVDIDAVWLEREKEQNARNLENQRKNEPK